LNSSRRLVRVGRVIIEKDWIAFRTPILLITTSMIAGSVMTAAGFVPPAQVRQMAAGMLAAVPFIYAQFCFDSARRDGGLQLLLALPMTPTELVLAKFASLFSMTLFTINVPVILIRDLRVMAYTNATGLFMASVFMAFSVVSSKPWVPQVPLWLVILLSIPLRGRVDFPPSLVAHASLAASTAVALIPGIVFVSCRSFSRDSL
jgi:hypothetical protein